ncbi:MAG: tandem-95 repeat protein, partial [Colwellia sp.]
GSADEALDHDLSDGNIVIEAGIRGEISFNILTDEDSNEGDEDIIITLDASLNLGNKTSHKLVIAEQNIAPTLTLNALQNNIQTLTATQINGLVTVNLSIFDPNTNDSHSIDWSDSDRALVNQSSDELSFIFDPSYLTIGLYRVNVKITDDLGLSDTGYISIKVIEVQQTLTTTDSDGDGIPDNEEGHQDKDNDGIPDYLDAIAANNVLPANGNNQQQFLVEGDPGVNLQLGDKALLSENAGIQIDAANLRADENAKNIGGLFDFIANGLPVPGQSYNIVFPQRSAIPIGAILRKHSEDELGQEQWRDFIEITDTDLIRSAEGERGFCPPPGNSSEWLPGLTAGDWCIQITLRDGGPNDDDGLENGVIVDPVGVAVAVSNNNFPEAVDDSVNITKDSSLVIINVLDNDLDADGDTLSLSSVNADLGIAVIQGESILYTPPADFIGNDRLVYSISDGNGGSAAAIVTILVLDGNQLPLALDDNASGNDATDITIDVLANDTDADGDTLSIESASTSQGSVQVIDNELYYQPELGHVGSVRIEYVVNDGQGGLGGAALRLDIVQSNRAPEAKNDSATTTDRDSIVINVLSNDSDIDNDDLTLIHAIAQYGVASIDNNQLLYQPKLGFDGTDIVSYRISDGKGAESSGNVNITVTAYQTLKVENSSGGSMGALL